tara:strand:- start:55 stop:489 length:435 start_codon:yes stop_codon:yes gene_type:complete
MATEILVNDGGAPARIMNLGVAGAAIEAGMFVDIDSNGKIQAATDDQEAASSGGKVALGVLLVDAVSGEPTSVITGKGIVCNVQAAESIATIGTEVTIDNAGKAEPTADADAHRAVGITLAASVTTATKADGSAIPHMVKVLLL